MTKTPSDVLAFRHRRGWTQSQMANVFGVTERSVRTWERKGAAGPTAALMDMIDGIMRGPPTVAK